MNKPAKKPFCGTSTQTARLLHVRLIVLFISGALFGCSTTHQSTSIHQTFPSPLYLYWGSEVYGSANRFLSTGFQPGEEISIGGDDFMDLGGMIKQSGTNLFGDLTGGTGQESQFYRGEMPLEKPCFAQGGAASGGAGGPFWFLVSTNPNCRTILEKVNAVMGLTNAPFNHPAAVLDSPPLITNRPSQLDPATGLPYGHRLVDPATGLPLSPKHNE